MQYIKSFEDFINENLNESGPTKGTSTDFNLKDFKMFFGREYGYISHDIKDKDVQKFIDNNKEFKGKVRSLASVADQFQDYLVSQGLADVQESTVTESELITEARSVSTISKELESTASSMKSTVEKWKKAEGDKKDKFKDDLKKLTDKKRDLAKELTTAVKELDKYATLQVDESLINEASSSMTINDFSSAFEDFYISINGWLKNKNMDPDTVKDLREAFKHLDNAWKNEADAHGVNYKAFKMKF